MNEMKPVNLRSFRRKVRDTRQSFRKFLNKMEKQPVRGLDKLTARLGPEVWSEVDCLSCANCCKTMTPTFTGKDLERIAAHFGQTPKEFQKQWLKKSGGDLVNKAQPCQFLNLQDNKCSIYAIRPADCSGFPHFPKKMKDYVHVHRQNLEYCPATHRMVEKMMSHVNNMAQR